MVVTMTTKMYEFEPQVTTCIQRFNVYSDFWESVGDSQYMEFKYSQPDIPSIKERIDQYLEIETPIE
jgi:hypothetical protein